MKPLASARQRFDEILTRLGFECVDKAALRYDRTFTDRLQMFTVEKERGVNRLHFYLREFSDPERLMNLSDFDENHRFDFRDEASLQEALDRAHSLFVTFGPRWLAGEDLDSPEIDARRRRSLEARTSRSLALARQHFKNGEYAAAVAVFESIAGNLDGVSAKMLSLAKQRAAAN
jgi:hypothetical protein